MQNIQLMHRNKGNLNLLKIVLCIALLITSFRCAYGIGSSDKTINDTDKTIEFPTVKDFKIEKQEYIFLESKRGFLETEGFDSPLFDKIPEKRMGCDVIVQKIPTKKMFEYFFEGVIGYNIFHSIYNDLFQLLPKPIAVIIFKFIRVIQLFVFLPKN